MGTRCAHGGGLGRIASTIAQKAKGGQRKAEEDVTTHLSAPSRQICAELGPSRQICAPLGAAFLPSDCSQANFGEPQPSDPCKMERTGACGQEHRTQFRDGAFACAMAAARLDEEDELAEPWLELECVRAPAARRAS